VIEAHRRRAARRVHDCEADGIGVADTLIRELREPLARGRMVRRGRKLDRQQRADLNAIEYAQRRRNADVEEDESLHLGEDQVGRHQPDTVADRIAEHLLSIRVILILRADQRDPCTAIDEYACGGRDASGRPPSPLTLPSRPRRESALPMSLLTAHKILIASAVALFAFYALWEMRHYTSDDDVWALARASAAAVGAIGFAVYLRAVIRRGTL
jgi:hypothetical protein